MRNVSTVIRPGTLTLVLAPAGHGKSALLKALANRGLPVNSGAVRYNGLGADDARDAAGVYVRKLVQYVDQCDAHNPLLTVRETFQFAVDNYAVDASQCADVLADAAAQNSAQAQADRRALHASKVERMLHLLGLTACADVCVGNALVRGVSGGQRRRVTLGESLLSDARVVCVDEVTNGLDAATALDICRSLQTWAQLTGGAIVAALQQPTPEVYACFDQLILLREARVVYSGPTAHAIPYLERLGFRWYTHAHQTSRPSPAH